MYQRTELFDELSQEDISASLRSCVLPEKDEYTEEEADRFRECRSLIEQGQTYEQVAAHFQQQDNPPGMIPVQRGQPLTTQTSFESHRSPKKGLSSLYRKNCPQHQLADKPESTLGISELQDLAKEQCGTRIPLKEVVQILSACGLPDKDQYTSSEGDRFLEACDLLKQQNKSYEEVAAHFGVASSQAPPPNALDRLLELLGDSALAADEELFRLIKKITAKQAERSNVKQLVELSYIEDLANQFSSSQNKTRSLFHELEQRTMDYIEGKSPARSLQTNWDWAPNSLPSSSPKPMILPEGSDNGMSGE